MGSREMEDPQTYARIFCRKMGMSNDRVAFREAEELFLQAMNGVLDKAKETVQSNGVWSIEALDALRNRLNNPRG